MDPGELAQTCSPAGVGPSCQAQIDTISSDGRQKRRPGVGGPAATLMRETRREVCPTVHLEQNVGYLESRKQIVGRVTEAYGLRWDVGTKRCDLQLAVSGIDIRQLAGGGERRDVCQFLGQRRAPLSHVLDGIGVDFNRERPFCLRDLESRPRDEIGLEVLIVPASFNPDIAGAVPVGSSDKAQRS